MKLSKEDILHLAELSRLSLPDDKLESLTEDFGAILGYVERIQKIDVTGVEPFAMPAKAKGWRTDEAMEIDDLTRELILSNMPSRHGDLLVAPGVFEVPKK